MIKRGLETFGTAYIRHLRLSRSASGKRPTSTLLRVSRQRNYATAATKTKHKPEPIWEEGSQQEQEPEKPYEEVEEREVPKERERSRPWRYLVFTPLLPLLGVFSYTHYTGLEELREPTGSTPALPLPEQVEISLYRCLPWRTISRIWGAINEMPLPAWARTPFLTWYSKTFGCNLEEAQMEDLTEFRNLGEFFRRELKPDVRPIAKTPLTSPADGSILFLGRVARSRVEQVKGVTYSLEGFLGPVSWDGCTSSEEGDCEFGRRLLKDPQKNCLYTAVIYLAPGDYHRFHSPANWTIKHRRHFPGELLSVNPSMSGWISGLYSLNERALYMGEWSEGFFCMGAVGATNVGSIRVYGDPSLSTNKGDLPWVEGGALARVRGGNRRFRDEPLSLQLSKGEPFGEFNLGSTVVLLFEASKELQDQLTFDPKSHTLKRVRMGESLLAGSQSQSQSQSQS